jgi:anti-sigma factor RsiW
MRLRREITCRELVEIVTDYVEGTMPARERRRFDRHLGDCDGCTHYLEQMRTTIALTSGLTADAVPPEAVAPLLAAFRDWHSGEPG